MYFQKQRQPRQQVRLVQTPCQICLQTVTKTQTNNQTAQPDHRLLFSQPRSLPLLGDDLEELHAASALEPLLLYRSMIRRSVLRAFRIQANLPVAFRISYTMKIFQMLLELLTDWKYFWLMLGTEVVQVLTLLWSNSIDQQKTIEVIIRLERNTGIDCDCQPSCFVSVWCNRAQSYILYAKNYIFLPPHTSRLSTTLIAPRTFCGPLSPVCTYK